MNKTDLFYEQYALMCKTIVNPIRLKIIESIGSRKMNVTELQNKIDISMSNLSNHLSALYRVGVLNREKKGNHVYYFLTESSLLSVLSKMQDVIRSIASHRDSMMKS
jgi:ArsR family transcriptional regulator